MSFWQAKNALLSTGQTTDRTTAGRTSNDDGGEERGADRQYEALSTGQYSGTTAIVVNAKTDTHTNNCVVDKRTGLMWNSTDSASVGPGNDGQLLWDDTGGSDEDIFAYCDAANAASLSGFSDWRIPNLYELQSLLNYEAANAVPDSTYFNYGGTIYTSTTQPNSTTKAISVTSTSGLCVGSTKTTNADLCVLVRG